MRDLREQWGVILSCMSKLPRRRFDVGALMRGCEVKVIDGVLLLTARDAKWGRMLVEEVFDAETKPLVEEVISRIMGVQLSLAVTWEETLLERHYQARGRITDTLPTWLEENGL
jgi:hypothetical protein